MRAPRVEPRAAGGVIESYRRLSAGLVAGLRALGLAVAQVETADDKGESAACFDAPSSYEITVDDILSANALNSPGELPVGFLLTLPAPDTTSNFEGTWSPILSSRLTRA